MTSQDRVLFHFPLDGQWKWHVAEFGEDKDDITLDALGSLCSISLDGKYIVFVDHDNFSFYDIAQRSVIQSQRYSRSIEVFFVKWISEKNVYAATSEGILRISMSSIEHVIHYEPTIKPDCVSDIQIDEDHGYYLIQSNENGTGYCQYGSLTAQHGEVIRGRAACLFYVKNCFYDDLMICYMRQEESKPESFFMNTRCLTHPKAFEMNEIEMSFTGSYENEYPMHIIPYPQGCLGYVFTQEKVMIFDMMIGIRIYTAGFGEHPICAYARSDQGGVVVVNEQESNAAVVSIPDMENFLHAYISLGDNVKCSAMHIACRLGLRDTDDRDMQLLCEVLFKNTVIGALPTVRALIHKMSLPNSEKALAEIGNAKGLQRLSRLLFEIWDEKKDINWLFEVENWIRAQCDWPLLENAPKSTMIAGDDPISSIVERFLKEGIDVDSDIGKEIIRDMFPDAFDRAMNTVLIRRKIAEIRTKQYQDLAERMKERNVKAGDEYYISILEEVYEDEEQRKEADAQLREFF